MVRTTLLLLIALTGPGCGQFIDPLDYDPSGTPNGADIVVRDDVKSLKHTAFAQLVSRFVTQSSDGAYVVFDYDALAASVDARFELDGYLALIAAVDAKGLDGRAEKLAYWINGYNASVIKGVLRSYDGDHGFKTIESSGFFTNARYIFGGERLSLNQVEHGPARNDFDARSEDFVGLESQTVAKLKAWANDIWGSDTPYARLHAAFVCAALSCPNLPGAAPFIFAPQNLDKHLDEYTTAWLNSAAKGAGANGISKLFEWYKGDFVRSHGSVEAFIKAFRTEGTTGVALGKTLEYDWTLNSMPNLPAP